MRYKNNKPGQKVTRTCDNCKKLLRLAEAYKPLFVGTKASKYKYLCPKCYDLWLEGELDE